MCWTQCRLHCHLGNELVTCLHPGDMANHFCYVFVPFCLGPAPLQVRYELLDCNHAFLEAVLKMVGLMETGMVRGGETLVPHLFQFLVLLAYDQSKLVTVPQVRQSKILVSELAAPLSALR